MYRLLFFALIQSLLLCAGQMFMKLALKSMGAVTFSWTFVCSQLTNWWWPACGISFTAAGLLWMYILKHWSFSQAYPLSSLAYVFGMIAAMLVFHEHVAWTQWAGILLIMAGCYLVVN
ncbi:MAG: EamA family transporter [Paludibacteraceae bacterium]|nr:EamA family transporter [Paludibacteraceae bacterium]